LDLNICYIDTDDVVSFGAFDHQDTKIYALNSVQMNVDGVESLTATGAGIDVAGDVSATARISTLGDISAGGDMLLTVNQAINFNQDYLGLGWEIRELDSSGSLEFNYNLSNGPRSLVMSILASGVLQTSGATSSIQPSAVDHLTRKDDVDMQVQQHASATDALNASVDNFFLHVGPIPEGA